MYEFINCRECNEEASNNNIFAVDFDLAMPIAANKIGSFEYAYKLNQELIAFNKWYNIHDFISLEDVIKSREKYCNSSILYKTRQTIMLLLYKKYVYQRS